MWWGGRVLSSRNSFSVFLHSFYELNICFFAVTHSKEARRRCLFALRERVGSALSWKFTAIRNKQSSCALKSCWLCWINCVYRLIFPYRSCFSAFSVNYGYFQSLTGNPSRRLICETALCPQRRDLARSEGRCLETDLAEDSQLDSVRAANI